MLQQILREVEVECLPADLPEAIEIDVTNLNLGDSICFADIKLDKVTVLGDPETVIVTVTSPRGEAEPTTAVEESAEEPELVKRKGKEEEE